MNIQQLFMMQKELDDFIEQTQNIQQDVFQEKGLALMVELAELANETRCFKFWSTKGPSAREVILEEYVDSIHFILSLGLLKNYTTIEKWPVIEEQRHLTATFLETQGAILAFIQQPTKDRYLAIWQCYGLLAYNLGFTFEDVVRAYIEKNEENYNRQRTGY
ncbi:dUTP diphosphatase [Lysinibacillus sp. FSL M8-0216]|uniref:dUTP diphosphatase n=1 Tax=Lysinibacillus TaxID=400634 RepID=UPI00088BAE44|nr:dUTP diphosphatase [Lysinibacillus fusiformis]SCX52658.1 Dimeric dUTPase, all-alpha-NTP-PPase (MazG) superfamily [Lysinibacillus fusiformis]SDB27131.1 Dimeric dUTPase, all-alpha-NTP-PPase (MazG) superfamily [Lysinibacillus fusiformis]SFI20097.1 Dimeric dUTPase, all-alpha-NTP-PPase (MazG) superfamily [Lysinibacillus fusiformis]SFS79972.1 Dimeric dUTPase, all-alpha-NTP-PPase (MazG) superfamily [Lysinibacillus fusiformis]